jgi:cold shock protein
MLRAIRKFVFGRDRDERQESEVAVEEHGSSDRASNPDDALESAKPGFEEPSGPAQEKEEHGSSDQASNPDDALQSSGPEFEEPAGPPVRGKVKWFNPGKRYGFVELSDGLGDAFLHVSVLGRAGISALRPGETLELRVAPGQRSLQVTEIISVDSKTATPPPGSNFGSPHDDRSASEASVQEMGTVKWYSGAKGFGFIVRDGGGKDAFVHASVLQRAGITRLAEGQRVYIGIIEGRRGPEAGSIQLA